MSAVLSRALVALAALLGLVAVPLFDAATAEGIELRRKAVERLVERWPAHWSASIDAAIAAADAPDGLLLVYVRRQNFACLALERAAGEDTVLDEALDGFTLLALDLDGTSEQRSLAHDLGLDAAPLFAVFGPGVFRGWPDPDTPLSDHFPHAIVPVTGGLHDPFGLAHTLTTLDPTGATALGEWSAAQDSPPDVDAVFDQIDRFEAAGRYERAENLLTDTLAGELQPNGPLHRLARLRDAIAHHSVEGAADNEGTIERALLIEDDARILYRGWSLLASVFELRARAADRSEGGSYRGASAVRWNRRMRRATREAWLGCPDALVLPFGSLLIERYGRSPADLDSADRIFCRAVLRTLREEASDSPRVARASEVVGSLR